MTMTATFSNGYTDTYKGHRDVKAAWMITRVEDGKVLASGHSLDRIKADKTASGTLRDLGWSVGVKTPSFDATFCVASLRFWGYDGSRSVAARRRWCREQNAERLAEIRARTMIEIIDIGSAERPERVRLSGGTMTSKSAGC